MLVELQISNFAIIKKLQVSFYRGFNVLSGETGAGKSIILKSLALLMGEKALSDTVRTNAEFATLEGAFDISDRPDISQRVENMGISSTEDNILIVRRVISKQGKSRVYLNGSLCSLNDLREIVSPMITVTGNLAPLIEITGQHDNRHLQSKAYHLDLVDQFSGLWTKREQFSEKYENLKILEIELEDIEKKSMEREQRLDFLKFQENEIESLNLKLGEEDELEARYKTLSNATRLQDFFSQAEATLYGDDDSALTRIDRVLHRALDLERFSPTLVEKLEPLKQARTLLDESVHDLRDFFDDLDSDPNELDHIEARLTQLKRLQKKHGSAVSDILSQLNEIKSEIQKLEGADDRIDELKKVIAQFNLELKALSEDLHTARLAASRTLSKKVNDELKDLNMKGVELKIQVSKVNLNTTGASDVEFLIGSGKSDSARSLSKYASGGELSRILLSLKKIIGNNDFPRTYLFDEVDAGVSGPTAEKVGRKLKAIAQGQQVICVTHLPQVAAFADQHFLIEKENLKSDVTMKVVELSKENRIQEIARLISGEKISKTSLEHAKQLIRESHK
ncbi:MAG: DNA repair protein RecN [Bdellovibrionales bacterium]|nr:DNA repair protein RecN [Bdellovibrionales bacterium]